jgi:hypothetical protein
MPKGKSRVKGVDFGFSAMRTETDLGERDSITFPKHSYVNEKYLDYESLNMPRGDTTLDQMVLDETLLETARSANLKQPAGYYNFDAKKLKDYPAYHAQNLLLPRRETTSLLPEVKEDSIKEPSQGQTTPKSGNPQSRKDSIWGSVDIGKNTVGSILNFKSSLDGVRNSV